MARPQDKASLIQAAQEQFQILESLLQTTDGKILNAPIQLEGKEAHWQRDKSVKDVLVHLYEWHQLLLLWLDRNLNGEMSPFLPEPYNWRNYGEMNLEFITKHQETDFESAHAHLIQSHQDVMVAIDKLSNEALFTKAYYDWAPTSTVGSYCVSATSSHYAWAIKKLKKHIKQF